MCLRPFLLRFDLLNKNCFRKPACAAKNCQTSQLWFACPAEAGQRLECPLRFGLCPAQSGHSAALFRFNADESANIAGFL